MNGVVHITLCGVLGIAEVNTGCNPFGVPRGSRGNPEWVMGVSPVHTWSLPNQAEPPGLPLCSSPSSTLLSMQASDGVRNFRVAVTNTELMGISSPLLPIKNK